MAGSLDDKGSSSNGIQGVLRHVAVTYRHRAVFSGYPVVALIDRMLACDSHDGPETKLKKLELLCKRPADNAAETETCFHPALDMARHQQVKSLQRRAPTSLSHPWKQRGKRTEACVLLALLYDCFTEGLDYTEGEQ